MANVFRVVLVLIIISVANIELIFPKKIVDNVVNINNLKKIMYSI